MAGTGTRTGPGPGTGSDPETFSGRSEMRYFRTAEVGATGDIHGSAGVERLE